MFVILSQISFAQKITRVNLLSSESFIGIKVNGKSTQKVIKPLFSQDNATLTCDSALFYIEKNSFDAFGNVHINQADTINIFADNLNYNGNTKQAVLTNNVRLLDRDAVLTTNNLDYNMASKVGRYTNGGKIVNGENTLTSTNGYYFSNSSDAYFRYDVKVKSPDVTIYSDTLKYNTLSKIAYFFGPTHIYGKSDTLYTENGFYNTLTDQASFGKKNLYTQNSKSLKGDSLYYDGKAGFGRAVKNILFKDTIQKVELHGNLGIYRKKDESIEVTKNAYVIFETEKDSISRDSIYLTADTLTSRVLSQMQLYQMKIAQELKNAPPDTSNNKNLSLIDSLPNIQKPSPKKSKELNTININKNKVEPIAKEIYLRKAENYKTLRLEAIKPYTLGIRLSKPTIEKNLPNKRIFIPPAEASDTDTTKIRIVSAYRKVKIFKSDLQSIADSAFFSYGDSVLRLYVKPMVWAQGSQLSADTMYLQLKNKKLDNMDMIRNSIIVNAEKDSVTFNQIGGKKMKGYFVKEKLDHVFVNGNAESIYFPQDSSEKGSMLRSISASMRINFAKDSLLDITWIRKPELKTYPKTKLTEELKTLTNFTWKPKDRPTSKEQIIPTLAKSVANKPKNKINSPTVKKPIKKPAAVKKKPIS